MTSDRTSFHSLKISGTGWLCIFDQGEWLAVVKLTDEQVREYRETVRNLDISGRIS